MDVLFMAEHSGVTYLSTLSSHESDLCVHSCPLQKKKKKPCLTKAASSSDQWAYAHHVEGSFLGTAAVVSMLGPMTSPTTGF